MLARHYNNGMIMLIYACLFIMLIYFLDNYRVFAINRRYNLKIRMLG